MAFDGHQRAFANSLLGTYQRQMGVNVNSVNGVPFPSTSVPAASHREHDNASGVPWPHNTQDDPFTLTTCAQTSVKNRKPADSVDCNCEAELQDLVSNILDEGQSRDGNYSESLPASKHIWSPETLREGQYFNTQAEVLHTSIISSNCLSHETLRKTQQESVARAVDALNQGPAGHTTNSQWLMNLPNGDNYSFHPQKLPPGLTIPSTGNTDPSQMQQSKHASMSVHNDRGNDQPMNNYPELDGIFKYQNKMNHYGFDAFYEGQYIQNSVNLIPSEEHVQEDINQLVSSFESFVGCDDDRAVHGEFPNIYKPTVGMHKEEALANQYKITAPAMSMSTPVMQIPKHLLADIEAVQRERTGLRKQTFKLDDFQDLSDFSLHHTEYFHPTKEFSTTLKNPSQYPSKMTTHRENINVRQNQQLKHHVQQSQPQKNIKQQMQKEKKMMPLSGFLENGFSRKQQTSTHMTERDKQPLSQIPHLDYRGIMQAERLDGQKGMLSPGNMQQFTSLMYHINNQRRNSSMSMAANVSSRSTLTHGNDFPEMYMGDMSVNKAAALNYYINDRTPHRGENAFQGSSSAAASSPMMNEGRPTMQLYFNLDECYEQWRSLENERKKIEMILKRLFPGKRSTEETSTVLQKNLRIPPIIDHLTVNQIREQAQVGRLLDRMERFCGAPLHISIHTALKRHHAAVCIMQERCKEDCVNMSKHQQQGGSFTEDRDMLLMVMALSDLAATTRRLRTALWCALQMMLPKPVKMQDHHVYEEATSTEKCSSPFEFYSFHL